MSFLLQIPLSLLTDSFKLTHSLVQPKDIEKATVYGEFQSSYLKDPEDHRIVFYGLFYYLKQYLSRRLTKQDLKQTQAFINTLRTGFKPYPFPLELFEKIVEEHDGYFPVKLEAILEGSVVYPHVPVIQLTVTKKEFTPLLTFLETLLTMIWV